MQDLSDDDAAMAAVLRTTRTIAMVGASANASRPSHGVMRYLLDVGYTVIPVTPKPEPIHGINPVPSLEAAAKQAGGYLDMVDVFRDPSALPQVVHDTIATGAAILWTQLGVVDEGALHRAIANGIGVVSDRCIKVEHARLIGAP